MTNFSNTAKNLAKILSGSVKVLFGGKIAAPGEPLKSYMENAVAKAATDPSLVERGAAKAVMKSFPHSNTKGGEEWVTTEFYKEDGTFITTKHVKGDGTIKTD